jgi:ABC-2 type transport system ATP-binding protein
MTIGEESATSGVRARDVRKSFRVRRAEQQVLKGIDLDVHHGEVVGLIGPNGAGKTTLMSCLLGFLTPSGGEIRIDGRANDDLRIRARTGFVPERMNFDRGESGRSFLRYMARLARVEAPESRVEELLDRLQLSDAADKRLAQYSRGMLQRIGMAQALVANPDYLFLDEPTSGLDPNGVMLVREVIAEERARGAAVLLNSHQLAEVERVCDRVLFLSKGVIAQRETLRHADEIPIVITLLTGSFDPARIQETLGIVPAEGIIRATVSSDAQVADLVRALTALGAGVIDVRRQSADLEQIFRSTS